MEKITLGKLPNVLTARELIDLAFKRAAEGATKAEGTPREVAIERERQRITIATTTVAEHLKEIVAAFPSLANLPPFYRDLVEAIEGIDELRKALGAISGGARVVDKIRREQLRRLKLIKYPAEAAAVRRQAYGRVSSVLKKLDRSLIFLKEAAKKLSDLPDVYVDMPTIVIAGYPNVGKSTLLKALTGSTPKIAPYPFTTTGLQLGYFEHGHQRYQVVDTPGLLDRPLEKRNKAERQAITALKNLARTIVFVIDPSETCGYQLEDQLRLLEDLRKSFPETRFLVVANKTDLLNEEKIIELRKTHPDILFLTANTGEGVDTLKQELV
ncbi:MAG: NOG1 family protein [Candidatus Hadarchaeum sp.]|uniref:NOG1 family protein n=1 Tax=Candidatus Hadarchaeum sp. TaxID=2883567 RepID=UPI003D09C460